MLYKFTTTHGRKYLNGLQSSRGLHSDHCLPSSTGLQPESGQHIVVVDLARDRVANIAQQCLVVRRRVSHNLCAVLLDIQSNHVTALVYNH